MLNGSGPILQSTRARVHLYPLSGPSLHRAKPICIDSKTLNQLAFVCRLRYEHFLFALSGVKIQRLASVRTDLAQSGTLVVKPKTSACPSPSSTAASTAQTGYKALHMLMCATSAWRSCFWNIVFRLISAILQYRNTLVHKILRRRFLEL